MAASLEIGKKSLRPETIAGKVLENKKLLSEVMNGASFKKADIKYKSFKVLRILSDGNPKMLYSKWDFFAKLLGSKNNIEKWEGIYIISNLCSVDSKNKFEKLFDEYFSLLADESMVTAANIVGSSYKIAKVKPKLERRITNRLVKVEGLPQGEECINIVVGHAIKSFDNYFKDAKEKKKIIDFVKKQLKNTRPATRKKAEKFLKKWKVKMPHGKAG